MNIKDMKVVWVYFREKQQELAQLDFSKEIGEGTVMIENSDFIHRIDSSTQFQSDILVADYSHARGDPWDIWKRYMRKRAMSVLRQKKAKTFIALLGEDRGYFTVFMVSRGRRLVTGSVIGARFYARGDGREVSGDQALEMFTAGFGRADIILNYKVLLNNLFVRRTSVKDTT